MGDDRVVPAVQYLDTTPPDAMTTPAFGGVPTTAGGVPFNATADTVAHLGNYTLMDLVQMFVPIAFIIAAGLAAVFIFIGGMNFILSGGNEEKIKTAVNTIRYAIVGLVVTILSFTFVTIVGRIFGLDFISYLNYAKIRESITLMINPAADNNTQHFTLPRQ
ncbi:hypothetical protein HN954_00755 [bacterium]|jgi:cytochrome bd-type quinol oxidase subunit 2|nr:hypothetical protein [bacterium]MBT6832398.1 hypothetical protein [bacterium]MBT6995943.1 hypothetical protein [bacterium]MBT7772804.1 hypothetical protein [bacterium]